MRKLTVDIEVIDPIQGDNFGFKVANNGQFLTFTQSGLLPSNGWDKTYTNSGGTTSVVQVNRFLQLDSDLNIAATQSYGGFINGVVTSFTINGDDITFVGDFTQWRRDALSPVVTCSRVIQVNPLTHNTYGTGLNFYAGRIVQDSIGNQYIGGSFTSFRSGIINNAVKVTSEGLLSATFRDNLMSNGTATLRGFNSQVKAIAIQADSKPIFGGWFTNINGDARARIARLQGNGTQAGTFDNLFVNGGFNGDVNDIAIQSDGRIICVGAFTTNSGSILDRNKICRLLTNGTVDLSFATSALFAGSSDVLDCVKIQSDGKILVGGRFTNSIARLLTNNSSDGSFSVGSGFAYSLGTPRVLAIETLTNGKIVVGGTFDSYDGNTCGHLVMLNSDGTFYKSLNLNYGITDYGTGTVRCIKRDAMDNIYISGNFTNYAITTTVAATGDLYSIPLSEDIVVDYGTGFDNNFIRTIIQHNDKLYIGGSFISYNGVTAYNIISLNLDGSINTDFDYETGFSSSIFTIIYTIIQHNNVLYIGGSFTSYNGTTANGIISLNLDGSIANTIPNLSQTVENTYNNLVEFNMAPGITYSIIDNIVRMEYEFDDDEIVVDDVFDVTDHVELTVTNESMSINERIDEIVTRSDHKIQTQETVPFTSTNFKIRIYEGALFSGVTASPVKYNITKPKIVSTQTNIYIDVSNLIKEDFEWNIGYFLGNDLTNAVNIPDNVSKWVYIEETNYSATASVVSLVKHYLYAIDGLLYNNEVQSLPNLLVNGNKRFIHREQQQRLYFQTNFLTSIQVIDENGLSYNPVFDVNLELDNKAYIQSLSIDKSSSGRWVDYIFTYDGSVEKVRYYFTDGCVSNKYYDLIFKNKWGVLESLAVIKKSKINLESTGEDYKRSIVDMNGNYDITRHTSRKFDVDMNESFTLNTDILPQYMNDVIVDLYLSDEVWLKSDDYYIPVLIDGSLGDLKLRQDAPISYTIKAKSSHQKIKNIL